MFIDTLDKTPGRYPACAHLIAEAQAERVKIVTSVITIAELCGKHGEGAVSDDRSRLILEFLENDYFVIRQVDRPTAELAHRLARKHGLETMDAIHLATAIVAEVPVVHTYDGLKKKRKGLLKWNGALGDPPHLAITVPPDPPPLASPRPFQPTLLDEVETPQAEQDAE